MGDVEASPSGGVESQYEIPPFSAFKSNPNSLNRDGGQYLVGSLTGAVASQNVTEAFTKVG